MTFVVAMMTGPALAGVLLAFTGHGWTLTIDVILMLSHVPRALWFPPLLGGFLVIALVALLARRSRRFRAYGAENPEP